MAIGGGYAQAGAGTLDTIVSWITGNQALDETEAGRQQDYALAQTVRGDTLAQQRFQNQASLRAEDSAAQAFDWGKMRWGEEFGLTKQQYRDQLKRQKEQDKIAAKESDVASKKANLSNLVSNMNSVLSNDVQMKQMIASKLGAR